MERREEIDRKDSNGEKKKDEKGKMRKLLKKIAVPLVNGITVAAVSASLAISCTTEFKSQNTDATEETDSRDIVDEREDPTSETIDVPDVADTEDINDISSDDAVAEEEMIVCSATNGMQTVFIATDDSTVVGNVTVEYGGLDSDNNGIFRISCEEGFIGTLYIAQTGRDSLDLGGGYTIDITANVVGTHGSNATITVS